MNEKEYKEKLKVMSIMELIQLERSYDTTLKLIRQAISEMISK